MLAFADFNIIDRTTGTRQRVLRHWGLVETTDGIRLLGRVVVDSEAIPEGVAARLTQTSPIVARLDATTFQTESGSIYKVEGPAVADPTELLNKLAM